MKPLKATECWQRTVQRVTCDFGGARRLGPAGKRKTTHYRAGREPSRSGAIDLLLRSAAHSQAR